MTDDISIEHSIDDLREATEGRLATASSDYKVRGKKDAPSGTGVLGYNVATSGASHGVEGVADSESDGAAGLYGEAAATTGDVYGVHATTNSRRKGQKQLPAAVFAESPTNADALRAESRSRAILAKSSGLLTAEIINQGGGGLNVGLFSTASGTEGNAIQGLATESSMPGQTEGVLGRTKTPGDASSDEYPKGIRGTAESMTGTTIGVQGEIASRPGSGVVGLSATSGYAVSYSGTTATGVTGITDKNTTTSGIDFAAGVEGKASATSGTAFGVVGRAASSDGYGIWADGDAKVDGSETISGGTIHKQRGDPTTTELGSGEIMLYNSDGSGTGSAGDLVYAINDGGSIKTQIIVQRSNAT